MIRVVITEKGGSQRRAEFDKAEVTIGRVQGNDIILPKGNVSKRHSRIVLKDGRHIVVDLKSTNGTYVNGRKITSPLVIKGGDKIYIGDFILMLEETAQEEIGEPSPPPAAVMPVATAQGIGRPATAAQPVPFGSQANAPITAIPRPQLANEAAVESGSSAGFSSAPSSAGFASSPGSIPGAPSLQGAGTAANVPPNPTVPSFIARPSQVPQAPIIPRQPVEATPVRMPAAAPSPPQPSAPPPLSRAPAYEPEPAPASPATSDLSAQPEPAVGPKTTPPPLPSSSGSVSTAQPAPGVVHSMLPGPVGREGPMESALRLAVGRMSLSFDIEHPEAGAQVNSTRLAQARVAAAEAVQHLRAEGAISSSLDNDALVASVLREAVGLGALEPLLADPGVREIVVESPLRIVADLGQGLVPVAGSFSSAHGLLTVVKRLMAESGITLDPSKAVHETRILDGSRLLVILPPVASNGPIVEIRRRSHAHVSEAQLLEQGTANDEVLALLKSAVEDRKNVLVAGPIGAGVTNVLGVLAGFTREDERIVTVEDVPDLFIDREHVVSLSTGGLHNVTLRDIVIQASRMRADRIVVDDLRGAETRETLLTAASRQQGMLLGAHSSSSADALTYLTMLAQLDGALADNAAMRLVASAINLVVQIERTESGGRRIVSIVEVKGVNKQGFSTAELYKWSDKSKSD